MAGKLLFSALWAALAGAALAFAVFWLLQAVGPVRPEEAEVVARDSVTTGSERTYHLVLRTASGERFEAWNPDAALDQRPGQPVRLEISAVGRTVRAVVVHDHRVAIDTGGVLVFWAALFGVGMLIGALAGAADTGHPVAGVLSAAAGLGAGAVPVSLLF